MCTNQKIVKKNLTLGMIFSDTNISLAFRLVSRACTMRLTLF